MSPASTVREARIFLAPESWCGCSALSAHRVANATPCAPVRPTLVLCMQRAPLILPCPMRRTQGCRDASSRTSSEGLNECGIYLISAWSASGTARTRACPPAACLLPTLSESAFPVHRRSLNACTTPSGRLSANYKSAAMFDFLDDIILKAGTVVPGYLYT